MMPAQRFEFSKSEFKKDSRRVAIKVRTFVTLLGASLSIINRKLRQAVVLISPDP